MRNVWVYNADTDAVTEVPESAVPILAASGWSPMSKTDVAKIEKQQADERAEIEKSMASVAGAEQTTESPAQGATEKEKG